MVVLQKQQVRFVFVDMDVNPAVFGVLVVGF